MESITPTLTQESKKPRTNDDQPHPFDSVSMAQSASSSSSTTDSIMDIEIAVPPASSSTNTQEAVHTVSISQSDSPGQENAIKAEQQQEPQKKKGGPPPPPIAGKSGIPPPPMFKKKAPVKKKVDPLTDERKAYRNKARTIKDLVQRVLTDDEINRVPSDVGDRIVITKLDHVLQFIGKYATFQTEDLRKLTTLIRQLDTSYKVFDFKADHLEQTLSQARKALNALPAEVELTKDSEFIGEISVQEVRDELNNVINLIDEITELSSQLTALMDFMRETMGKPAEDAALRNQYSDFLEDETLAVEKQIQEELEEQHEQQEREIETPDDDALDMVDVMEVVQELSNEDIEVRSGGTANNDSMDVESDAQTSSSNSSSSSSSSTPKRATTPAMLALAGVSSSAQSSGLSEDSVSSVDGFQWVLDVMELHMKWNQDAQLDPDAICDFVSEVLNDRVHAPGSSAIHRKVHAFVKRFGGYFKYRANYKNWYKRYGEDTYIVFENIYGHKFGLAEKRAEAERELQERIAKRMEKVQSTFIADDGRDWEEEVEEEESAVEAEIRKLRESIFNKKKNKNQPPVTSMVTEEASASESFDVEDVEVELNTESMEAE
eukprot:TRINITY_DN1974_c1_g1_i1.p1 TRINITY_DN1974_c1_g1~~TRINITY_DN1974_c1_g1_i1.p1  ORF type:complete len:665 (+),score=245.09 TRINITY_DN1974_c1_g1_i1:181-1995(+)